MLSKWLARHPSPTEAAASLPPNGASLLRRWAAVGHTDGATAPAWTGRVAVELGAGLGLPSIVAGRLGLCTVATDEDAGVLALLVANTTSDGVAMADAAGSGPGAATVPPAEVSARHLKWGEAADPLVQLGLSAPPDVLLAVDVVYGKERRVWVALVETLVALSDERTLVLMAHGNGAAPGVHRMSGAFYELAAAHFESACLPLDADHPGCQMHCLVRRSLTCGTFSESYSLASSLIDQ